MREVIALTLDCSAIVLVALGFWLGFQRRSRVGVAFGVLGLAVMSASAASRAYPNPTRGALHESVQSLGAEIGRLRAELAATVDKLHKAEAAAKAFEQEVETLKREALAIGEKLAGETEAKLRLAKEVEALNREVSEARRKMNAAKARMGGLLKGIMSAGLSPKFYRVSMLPERELVAGKIGAYFSIRLLDETGSEFIFPKGRYRVPAFEAAIHHAADRVVTDILQALKGVAEYDLFVRGGADAEPFVGTEELPAGFSTILYRPRGEDGKYAASFIEQTFRVPLSNSDLPILRAEYVRSLIQNKVAPLSPHVLHNVPAGGGDHVRTVELILYVK